MWRTHTIKRKFYFRHKNEGSHVPTINSSGARLIILLVRKLEFEKPMFPTLFQIRQKQKFNLFYMILSEENMYDDHENLLKLMYRNYNLLNAVVVTAENGSADTTVLTYNPFNNKTIRLPNNAYKRKQLFVNKNSNIFGNPFNIVMYKDPIFTLICRQRLRTMNYNYDVFLPDLISSAMNGTLNLKTPYMNDSQTVDVTAVDMIINGINHPVGTILAVGLEETIMVRRDDICIIVPYNRNRKSFEIIYKTVEPFVWVSMIAVILQAWFALFVMRWKQFRVELSERWKHVFLFDLFGFHMGQGLTHMPNKVAPRLIIASCLFYCLVIRSIFEGLLYTSIANHKNSRISTIDELLNTNEHEILVNDLFYNFSGVFLNESPIKNRFRVINLLEYVDRIDSSAIHYAYVGRKSVAIFMESIHLIEGLPMYYTMAECAVPFMASYHVRLGSIFLDRVNRILRISEESGLFNYWENQLRSVYDRVKRIDQLFGNHAAVNLEHIGFIFLTWLYGVALATVVFVVECMGQGLKRMISFQQNDIAG